MASLTTVRLRIAVSARAPRPRGKIICHLEVIQEAHIGVAECDLPLRSRIWDP